MGAVRRWYIYLVCAVSLQSITWAAISLVRNLLAAARSVPTTAIALQVSILVVGLPLFLVHWLWAERLARQVPQEREDALRRLYLYGTLSGFLAPFVANTFDLVWEIVFRAIGGTDSGFLGQSPAEVVIRDLSTLVVLGLLWFYHWRVVTRDAGAAPETGAAAGVRRLYVLGFAAAGLAMTSVACITILRWIMLQVGAGAEIGGGGTARLSGEIARLIVGLPLWQIFWRWAQRLFRGDSEEERESALRKLYLYLTVLIAALTAVTSAALILGGFFRRLLSLPSSGDIRTPLSIVLVMCGVWAYHIAVLRGDAAAAAEAPRQAAIRRLYLYLIAGVGLSAFLIGLGGDFSVLIRSVFGRSFGGGLKEQLAWASAALIAGLPVWLLPWSQAQTRAVALTPAGAEERRSVVRKIYLYVFLFAATITVLTSGVFILWKILSVVLGERPGAGLLGDLAQAVAYAVIAVGVWLHHGAAIRGDGNLSKRERLERLGTTQVAVLDVGDGRFGRAVLDGLHRQLPGVVVDAIGLSESAAGAMQPESGEKKQGTLAERLAKAGLIVGPWEIIVAGGAQGAVSTDTAAAIVRSPARKLLAPSRAEGWEWAGVDRQTPEALARQAVHAIRQIAEGEEVRPPRPLTAGAIVGIVLGVLFLLLFVGLPLFFMVAGF